MTEYILSPNAIESINNIEDYSLENFGKKQTGIYLGDLKERLQYLAENPGHGKQRPDLAGFPCYSYPQGSHVIFYEIVSPEQINIIDVLHKTMLPELHLLD